MRVISSRWLRPCPLYTPPVATTDWMVQWGNRTDNLATGNSWREYLEDDQTWSFRGSKSRNKVSVGEPAEGSLPFVILWLTPLWIVPSRWGECWILKWSTCCFSPICATNCVFLRTFFSISCVRSDLHKTKTWQLLTVDLLACASMKNVASCDK